MLLSLVFFFFNLPATTVIYTLSLHDALPISGPGFTRGEHEGLVVFRESVHPQRRCEDDGVIRPVPGTQRSEEHTSELQSRGHLVCRLLLEKKKREDRITTSHQVEETQ